MKEDKQNLQTKNFITVSRDEHIAIPTPDREVRFAIRQQDWKRIKNKLLNCDLSPITNLSGWYFAVFGASFATLISIIQIKYASAAWTSSFHICFLLLSLLLGCIIFVTDRRFKNKTNTELRNLKEDMEDIESTIIQIDLQSS